MFCFAIGLVSKETGPFDYLAFHTQQARVSAKYNYFIAKTWQLAIEVNGNLVTLIEVNLKTIVLKLLGRLLDKILVWLKDIKLVNDSCFVLAGVA